MDDRWAVVFADPSRKVTWRGRKVELLEGPRWQGCKPDEVAAHHLALEWIGKTVVIEPGFPHTDVILRGVVETVMPGEGPYSKPRAVVRFHVLEHNVRRFVPVAMLHLYDDPAPEKPAVNPLMERDRLERA